MVLQAVDPFMSSEDIPKGSQWAAVLKEELSNCRFAVICVTPENQHAPWLNYEAGAASNVLGVSRVGPLLLDVSTTDIDGPFSIFQMTEATEEDVKRLVRSINSGLVSALTEEQLGRTFERWWPDLSEQLESIAAEPTASSLQHQRHLDEVVRETLDVVRDQSRLLARFVAEMKPRAATHNESDVIPVPESLGKLAMRAEDVKPGWRVYSDTFGEGVVVAKGKNRRTMIKALDSSKFYLVAKDATLEVREVVAEDLEPVEKVELDPNGGQDSTEVST